MTVHYAIHVPKATEVYGAGEDEIEALKRGQNFGVEDEYDVVTVFRIDGDVKTPVAFFWNGQRFPAQKVESPLPSNSSEQTIIIPQIPGVAMEIITPTTLMEGLIKKRVGYLAAKTLFCEIYPEDQVVDVYAPDQPVHSYSIDDTIDLSAVLPGFTLAVREIFGN